MGAKKYEWVGLIGDESLKMMMLFGCKVFYVFIALSRLFSSLFLCLHSGVYVNARCIDTRLFSFSSFFCLVFNLLLYIISSNSSDPSSPPLFGVFCFSSLMNLWTEQPIRSPSARSRRRQPLWARPPIQLPLCGRQRRHSSRPNVVPETWRRVLQVCVCRVCGFVWVWVNVCRVCGCVWVWMTRTGECRKVECKWGYVALGVGSCACFMLVFFSLFERPSLVMCEIHTTLLLLLLLLFLLLLQSPARNTEAAQQRAPTAKFWPKSRASDRNVWQQIKDFQLFACNHDHAS